MTFPKVDGHVEHGVVPGPLGEHLARQCLEARRTLEKQLVNTLIRRELKIPESFLGHRNSVSGVEEFRHSQSAVWALTITDCSLSSLVRHVDPVAHVLPRGETDLYGEDLDTGIAEYDRQ